MKKILLLLTLSALASAQPKLPRPAPALNLLSPCKGRPTVLAWIVTTCPHCKAFTHSVLEPEYESGRVCAVAIAFDDEGDTAKFAREQGLTFPVYKLSREVMRAFMGMTGPDRPVGTPQVAIIDKHGIIQAQSEPAGSPILQRRVIIDSILEAMK